jgi:hypothetical protein
LALDFRFAPALKGAENLGRLVLDFRFTLALKGAENLGRSLNNRCCVSFYYLLGIGKENKYDYLKRNYKYNTE